MTGEMIMWILISLFGVAGSALCSGMEIGYYALNRLRVRVSSARGEPAGRILDRLVHQPDHVLTGLLVGNNVFNYFGTLGVTALLVGAGLGDATVVVISAIIVTPCLLIFAEALPKDVFRVEADVLMPRLARPLRLGLLALSATGLPALLTLIASGVARLLGVARRSASRDARARIAGLLKEGASHGLLSESQITLVDRALIFRRATVAEEMTPWSAAHPLAAGAAAQAAARRASSDWAPVVDQAQHPIGVVRRLDLLLGSGSVAEHARPLIAVEPDMPLYEAATRLWGAGVGLGVVMRGRRPVGVVTLADLAEPLTGDLATW
ncbi:MAG: CNNM domain-containing protein [Phycisphaerales bacterium JB039]